jgi:D-hexose-6-phosphate mutarotase
MVSFETQITEISLPTIKKHIVKIVLKMRPQTQIKDKSHTENVDLMAYKSNKAFGNTGKIFYYTFPNNI